MARKQRVHYDGALYHVIVRGNNKEYIFKEDKWKEKYLETLLRYKKKYDFKLYSYCIMDNHAHMLIEVRDKELSKIMQGIQQVHTQKYNKAEKRTGHLFEQRYKAFLCDKDNYLLQLVRYIHQNPVRAGKTEELIYEWSSHKEYLDLRASEFVDKELVLGIFSNNKTKAVTVYKKFVNEEEEIEIEVTELKEPGNPAIPLGKSLNTMSIIELIQDISEQEGIAIAEIRGKSKNRMYSDIRKAIILLSEIFIYENNKTIAEALNMSQTMISKVKLAENIDNERVTEIINKYKESKLITQA